MCVCVWVCVCMHYHNDWTARHKMRNYCDDHKGISPNVINHNPQIFLICHNMQIYPQCVTFVHIRTCLEAFTNYPQFNIYNLSVSYNFWWVLPSFVHEINVQQRHLNLNYTWPKWPRYQVLGHCARGHIWLCRLGILNIIYRHILCLIEAKSWLPNTA